MWGPLCAAPKLEVVGVEHSARGHVPAPVRLAQQPGDHAVRHDPGGLPAACLEGRIQVPEIGLKPGFSAGELTQPGFSRGLGSESLSRVTYPPSSRRSPPRNWKCSSGRVRCPSSALGPASSHIWSALRIAASQAGSQIPAGISGYKGPNWGHSMVQRSPPTATSADGTAATLPQPSASRP